MYVADSDPPFLLYWPSKGPYTQGLFGLTQRNYVLYRLLAWLLGSDLRPTNYITGPCLIHSTTCRWLDASNRVTTGSQPAQKESNMFDY